jgi:uroporphyrin-III C-methyltransferase/precorrin-2 dehydrogenase/sirohydrochlorin ferrochelatase
MAPIGALVLVGRKEAEAALKQISDPSAFAGATTRARPGPVTLVGAGPGDLTS